MQADVDGDGVLNYSEFLAVSIHIKKMANDEHLHRAFSFFDKNKTGFIEVDELREALNDEGDEVSNTEEVINAIMHDVDTDKVRFHCLHISTCILCSSFINCFPEDVHGYLRHFLNIFISFPKEVSDEWVWLRFSLSDFGCFKCLYQRFIS